MDTVSSPSTAAVRSAGLDLMKVLATVAVVGLHMLDSRTSWLGLLLYYACGFAVPMFFMVNGALTMNRAEITWRYAVKKALKLLGMVFLWNMLRFAYVLVTQRQLTDPVRLTLLSLLQRGSFPVFWFFGALILIYLAAPLLHRLIKKRGYKLPLLCLAVLCLGADIASVIVGWPVQGAVCQTFRLWTWLLFYVLGGFLNSGEFSGRVKLSPKAGLLAAAVLTLVSVGYSWLSLNYLTFARPAEFYYDNIFHVLWVCALFLALKDNPCLKWLDKPALRLQPLTVGVYTLHVMVPGFLGFGNGLYAGIPLWLAVTAVSFLLSAVLIRIPYVKKLISL